MTFIPFDAEPAKISGLFVVEMKQIEDDRGVVREFFRTSDFATSTVPFAGPWAQVNVTESRRGVIRGLHGESMNKLVAATSGSAFGVYLDARKDSSSFGVVETVELRPGRGVFVPAGVCNGFQATADEPTQYLYCFDQEWSATMPGLAVNAFDPDLAIAWPIAIDRSDRALLSEKDAILPRLCEL